MGSVAAPKQVQRAAAAAKPTATVLPPSRIAAPKGAINGSGNGAIQCAGALKVSHPSDPAEKEAEDVGKRVAQAPPGGMHAEGRPALSSSNIAMRSPHVARMMNAIVQRESAVARLLRTCTPPTLRNNPVPATTLQREARPPKPASANAHIASPQEGRPNVGANLAAEIQASRSSGKPLPPSVRRFMEQRFAADFGAVRVHTDEAAASRSQALDARAFTVGGDIHFGAGEFQPDSQSGRELIAHELTHTIQQGAAPQAQTAVQRSVAVKEQSRPQAQRGLLDYIGDHLPSLPDPRAYVAEKAANIPGFTMFTIVIGFNPITGDDVDRSAGNILRGAIEMIPGGTYITDALNNHGIFDKVSTWVQTQFDTLKDIGSGVWDEIKAFIKGISITDIGALDELWEKGKRIVTSRIDQVEAFAIGLKDGIVDLIKDAILKPIGAFARTTSGYPLLCSVLGHDPITDEPAPQDAETLMGAFLTFIGEGELWATMQKAHAVPRAFAWFKGAVAAVKGFVAEIPGLFVTALKSLEIVDIILIPRAFAKLAHVFGGFAARFISWGAKAAWDLLEIIFDVVKPGIMGYIKRTGAALKGILRNPMPFVGNLVNAGKLGFQQFAANFGKHLKAGLIDWLTGALPGVYIPQSFELKEIVKFVLSVLGLTWQNIRGKLVKVVGEPAVKAMEAGFEIVKTLVTQGPAAAWEQIKAQLGNLKDMVIGGITDFVVDMVVTKAVPKIIAMFVPGAGFISAIISIYDTIMVFVQKLSKIAAVVGAFVNSIVQIAAGNIAAAAKRVETTLAGLLSLAISFLAGFAGLGKVADKVMGVIQKIRAPIDKAIDGVINWIVTMAKKLFAKVFGKEKKDERTPQQKQADLDRAMSEVEALQADPKATDQSIRKGLPRIKSKYKMQSLEVVVDADSELEEKLHVVGKINPEKSGSSKRIQKDGTVGPLGITRKMLSWTADTLKRLFKDPIWKKFEHLRGMYAEASLAIRHKVSISDTIKATDAAIAPKKPDPAGEMLAGKGYPVEGKPKTKPKIVAAARNLLQDANNDPKNLFIGDAHINSTVVKERYDAGDNGDANAREHVQQRSDFVEAWGFADEEFTITLQRKSKRLGTERETEGRQQREDRLKK